MMRMIRVLPMIGAVALSATVVAQKPPASSRGPNQWRVDSDHSAAQFSVRHLAVATVRGQLGPISGIVEYDGKDARSIKADVTIDVKGITTHNQRRDEDLRSPGFFDVARYPTIAFKSKRIEAGSGGAFKMIGDLTIRGTTKEVVLDVEAPSPVSKGMRGAVVGTSATTRIKRQDYGLRYNEMVEAVPVVGDDVTITIDMEIIR